MLYVNSKLFGHLKLRIKPPVIFINATDIWNHRLFVFLQLHLMKLFLQVYFKTISTSSDTVEKHIILQSQGFQGYKIWLLHRDNPPPPPPLKHPLVKDKQGHHPKLVSWVFTSRERCLNVQDVVVCSAHELAPVAQSGRCSNKGSLSNPASAVFKFHIQTALD